MPMWILFIAQLRPSMMMSSTRVASPSRNPIRAPGRRCGAMVMFSMPPARITSASPAVMAWAARCTAFIPEPQTLLIVMAGVSSGRPAAIQAWRAGFWPWPAWSTLPRMTSSISSAATPARFRASGMTIAPSLVAGISEREPRNRPTGVRHALRITTSGDKGSPFLLPTEMRPCKDMPSRLARPKRV